MGLLKDFREFAMQGNVIDLAVGVVIGAAFGKIVSAVVDNLILPVVSLVSGGGNFSDYFAVLQPGKNGATRFATLADAKAAGATVLAYGDLIQTVIDFFIVAFCIFLLLRVVARFRQKKLAEAVPPTHSEQLLTEIRDELRRGR